MRFVAPKINFLHSAGIVTPFSISDKPVILSVFMAYLRLKVGVTMFDGHKTKLKYLDVLSISQRWIGNHLISQCELRSVWKTCFHQSLTGTKANKLSLTQEQVTTQ